MRDEGRRLRRRRGGRFAVGLARGVVVASLLFGFGYGGVWGQSEGGDTYILVISGIGGEPRFEQQFSEWGTKIVEAAKTKHGVPAANITYLAAATGGAATGESRKENVEQAFADLATRAGAGDLVWVVLIGHGSFRGDESRINLPGPDLTAQDFAKLLEPIRARIAFVNTTSASGEWAKILSGPERAIVTATKSGVERNESVFGGYFVEALAGDVADTDKDGRVSLLEAYTYARAETQRFYEDDNRLITEHAQLEDTGDGEPAEEPGETEGMLAARMVLGAGGAAGVAIPADASPELRALLTKKAELEEQIADLRARRASMEPAEYERQLEPLLLELARTDSEIRRIRDGGGGP